MGRYLDEAMLKALEAEAAGDIDGAIKWMTKADKLQKIVEQNAPYRPNPATDFGASDLENFAAGAGKKIVDRGRGIAQLLQLGGIAPDFAGQKAIDDAKRRDSALMDTKAGVAGNLTSSVVEALLLGAGGAALRGVNGAGKAAKGAAAALEAMQGTSKIGSSIAGGAAMGALDPVASDDSRLVNALVSGAGNAIMPVLGMGGRAAKGAWSALTNSGAESEMAKQLAKSIGDKGKAQAVINQLLKPDQLIPGAPVSTLEAAPDFGLAAKLAEAPQNAAARAKHLAANTSAIESTLNGIRRPDDIVRALEAQLKDIGNTMYEGARNVDRRVDLSSIISNIEKKSSHEGAGNPFVQSAMQKAKQTLEESAKLRFPIQDVADSLKDWPKKSMLASDAAALKKVKNIAQQAAKGGIEKTDALDALMEIEDNLASRKLLSGAKYTRAALDNVTAALRDKTYKTETSPLALVGNVKALEEMKSTQPFQSKLIGDIQERLYGALPELGSARDAYRQQASGLNMAQLSNYIVDKSKSGTEFTAPGPHFYGDKIVRNLKRIIDDEYKVGVKATGFKGIADELSGSIGKNQAEIIDNIIKHGDRSSVATSLENALRSGGQPGQESGSALAGMAANVAGAQGLTTRALLHALRAGEGTLKSKSDTILQRAAQEREYAAKLISMGLVEPSQAMKMAKKIVDNLARATDAPVAGAWQDTTQPAPARPYYGAQ